MNRVHCLAFVVAALSSTAPLSGCKILGLDGSACDPDDAATCPDGQVCNADGACVRGEPVEGEGEAGEGEGDVGEGEGEGGEGEGEGGEGEGEGEGGEGEGEGDAPANFADENGVALVAVDVDGNVFYASDLQNGCIKRVASGGGAAVNVVCESGDRRIGGFVVEGANLFYISDGNGGLDRVRVIARTATTADSPTTISSGDEDIGSLATRGPGAIAARDQGGGVELVGWLGDKSEFAAVRGLRRANGLITNEFSYDAVGEQLNGGGISLGPVYFGFGCVLGGEVHLCLDDGYNNVDEDGSFNLDFAVFDNRGGEFLNGRGWTGLQVADEHIWGTRGGDDSGGIFGFDDDSNDQGGAQSRTITNAADPENPRVYASGLASDGFSLFWATAGVLQGGRKFGVFAVDLNDEAAVPVRIADLDNAGGGVAVDAFGSGLIYVAVPGENAVVTVPVP